MSRFKPVGTPMMDWLKESDLGLDYEQAVHGLQSNIAFSMNDPAYVAAEPKHLRVGIDSSKSDMLALVCLLVDKGIFTNPEYVEYVRLAANWEVKQREGDGVLKFR